MKEGDKKEHVYMFYFRNINNREIIGVVNIEPDEYRKGWLIGYVVDCGFNDKSYVGAESNASAHHVFNSGLYDYGKELVNL